MSEIKVNSIKGVAASTAALTINNTDGTCTANITNNLSNRNKVINGSAIVSQRGSNNVIGVQDGGFFCADRFKHVINAIGGYTIHHEADAPSGFSHSHKVQTTTADTSLDAGSVYMIRYIFEGQDVQDFAKGTSDAKQYALSFFVKTTNFTGTFVVELLDSVNTRHCCKSYTVSSAGSWQKVELIFPADTTGAITSDNAGRFEMNFYIGAGSGYTAGTLQTTWGGRSGNTNRATGQTAQIGSSTSNRFQITGVQLEVGSVATDFEHRSFAQELELCKRYYEQFTPKLLLIGRYSNNYGYPYTQYFYMVEKRAAPTCSHSGTFVSSTGYTGNPNFSDIQKDSVALYGSNQVDAGGIHYCHDNGSALIKYDAEL